MYEKIIENINQLKNQNISYEEKVGKVNDFSEIEDIKNELCDLLSWILKNSMDNELPSYVLKQINTCIHQLSTFASGVKQLVDQGIHTPNYPQGRTNYINQVKAYKDTILPTLSPVISKIKVENLEKTVSDKTIESIRTEYNLNIKEYNKKVKELENLIDKLQTKATERGVALSQTSFANRAEYHTSIENRWFLASIITSIVLLGALVLIFFGKIGVDTSTQTPFMLMRYVVNKLILLLFPSILLKICIKRYNIERHLRIIYSHRDTVLNQYNYFEAGIGDDKEGKNQFRLEVAKYIFSDPVTGYIKETDASDININPAISIMEKFIK